MYVVSTHLVPHPVVPTALLQIGYCCFARGNRFNVCFLWAVFLRKSDLQLHNFISLSLLPSTMVSYFYSEIKSVYTMVVHEIIMNDRWTFFYSSIYIEVLDSYAIIAKDVFIFVIRYTPLIRDWFISQMFTKKLLIWLWLIGTGIGTINYKNSRIWRY